MGKIERALAKRREALEGRKGSTRKQPVKKSTTSASSLNGDTSTFRRLEQFGQQGVIDDGIAEDNRLICSPQYQSSLASYKILRTRVLQRMRSNNWNRLALTSSRPGEGKTLTAINLAISLARQENQNVILVDLDLIRPAVCEYLGIVPRKGLSDYLSGNAKLEDIWISPGIEQLLVLASSERIENSSEALRSEKMAELLEGVAQKHTSSIIVFDMPPILMSDDVLAFGPLVDAILFVVGAGKSSRDDLERSKELLADFELLGTVLNNSSEASASYY